MKNLRHRPFGSIIINVCGVLFFLLLWQIVSVSIFQGAKNFPPPIVVLKAMKEYYGCGEMARDISASLWRAITGFLIGAFIGITMGMITGRINFFGYLFSPVFNFLRALPPVAILPLSIAIYSISDVGKIITISFGCFFPVWLNTHIGASNIPENYIRSARLLTTSRLKIFFKIELPLSLPYIVAGLRLSIAMAFVMVFVTELAGANAGIGFTIANSQLTYRIDIMMAALIVLAGLAAIMDWIIKALIYLFFPWLKNYK